MDYCKRRIKVAPDLKFEKIGKRVIESSQLDSNNYLNNAQYISVALSHLMLDIKTIKVSIQ